MKLTDTEMLMINGLGGIRNHIKNLLKGMEGMFYPFAIGLNSEYENISIAAYTGVEHPSAQELIDILDENLTKAIHNKRFIMAAKCVDVFVHESVGGINVKKNAVQITFFASDYRKELLWFYELDAEYNVILGDLDEGGTVLN